MDNTDNTTTAEVEAPAQRNFVQKAVDAARTKTGKTVLAVAGTAGALVGTYVLGFRRGQDNVIEVLNDADPEDETLEVELDVTVEDVTDKSEESEED